MILWHSKASTIVFTHCRTCTQRPEILAAMLREHWYIDLSGMLNLVQQALPIWSLQVPSPPSSLHQAPLNALLGAPPCVPTNTFAFSVSIQPKMSIASLTSADISSSALTSAAAEAAILLLS